MADAEKIVTGLIVAVVIIAVFSLFYVSKSLFFPLKDNPDTNIATGNAMGQKMSSMSLTSFDSELAKRFMDKNDDGKCDSCGMDIKLCMDSGQIQCNMDSSSTIGILDSQHIHADWKVYINGIALDFSDKAHMERMRNNLPVSSFIHVDSGAPAPEKTGDVIHMHATGVPLWIFFESIGMKFSNECFVMDDGKSNCNDDNNRLRFYVNGKENSEYEKYVFKDNDKILITYGSESKSQIEKQLASFTDFSKNH